MGLIQEAEANADRWKANEAQWLAWAAIAAPSPGDTHAQILVKHSEFHSYAQQAKAEHTAALDQLGTIAGGLIDVMRRLADAVEAAQANAQAFNEAGDPVRAAESLELAREGIEAYEATNNAYRQMIDAAESARIVGLRALIDTGEQLGAHSQGWIDGSTAGGTNDAIGDLLAELGKSFGAVAGAGAGLIAIALAGLLAWQLVKR